MNITANYLDKKIDRVINRTAKAISTALDKMVCDLPENAAGQMAIEVVVRKLVPLQPWFMALLMEDQQIRGTYDDAVSILPAAKPAPSGRPRRRITRAD
jgi:hypothetical protein